MTCDHWEEVIGIYYQCPCCQKMSDIYLADKNGFIEHKLLICGKCSMQLYRHNLYHSNCKMRTTFEINGEWKTVKKELKERMIIKI